MREVLIHQGTVWSVSLKRKVKLAHVVFKNGKGELAKRFALYFSTDTELDGPAHLPNVQSPLPDRICVQGCQTVHRIESMSGTKVKINCIFILTLPSLPSILQRATQYLNQPKEQRRPFSLADIKTENFNELMLDLFLSKFHINHNLEINKKAVKDIRKYGLIAA